MPDKYNRFLLKFNHIHSFEDVKEDVRYTIWDTSWEAAKENLPFGVGSGDIKDVLKSKYSERSLPYFNKREYNTHNQYLQILLAVGIPGILLFVSGLFYTLYVSMQKRCFLYLVFMLIIAINLLTESMLERQSGVVFYAIFNAFLCLIAFIIPHSKLPAKP
jgi:O-antigen ligase